MRIICSSVLAVVFASSLFGQSISIDPNLLQHSLYAESYISTSNDSKSPKNGLVGTPGLFYDQYNKFLVQTNMKIQNLTAGRIDITAGDTVWYKTKSGGVSFQGAGQSIDISPSDSVYSTKPIFPDLSTITFSGGVNISTGGTYSPGQYNKLSTGANATVKLKAGEYHFNDIQIGFQSLIQIIPDDDGSYKTTININNTLNLSSEAKLKVQDSTGFGKVLILYRGTSLVEFTNKSEINGTLIAPNARVNFNNNAVLKGQAMADSINLIGFDGGVGLEFKPLILSNIHITPPDFLYEDTLYKATENSDSNSYWTPLICSLSSVIPSTAPSDAWVQFKYAFIDSTAEYGKDYSTGSKTGIVKFVKGDSPEKIIDSIFVIDDSEDEVEEYFNVIFFDAEKSSNLTGYEINLGADTLFHTIRLIDDDPTNNAPTDITLSNNTFKENNAVDHVVGTLTTIDSDAGDTHTYSKVSGHPYLDVTGSSITVNKAVDYETETSKEFKITVKTDDGIDSYQKEFSITLLPVNDSTATGVVDSFTVLENVNLVKDSAAGLLSNDLDGDLPGSGNILRVLANTTPKHGTVTVNPDGSFTYKQTPGLEVAIDSFSYTIEDSTNYDNIGHTNTKPTWVFINITDVNDAEPSVSNHTITLYENDSTTIDLSSLISDDDNSFAELDVKASTPTYGTATITGTTLKYVSNQAGTIESTGDSFTITADDGTNSVATGTITVIITPVNDNASKATDNSYTIEEKATLNGNVYSDGTSDSDADKPIANNKYKVELVGAAPGSAVQFAISDSGKFVYENDGTPGTYTFKYSLRDSSTSYGNSYDKTLSSNEATVTITVNPSNSNDPVAGDTTLTDKLDENASLPIDVSSLVSDADFSKAGLTEKLTFSLINTPTAIGEAVYSGDSVITYTHGLGDVKTEKHFVDTIKYEISDAAGQKDTGTIIIPIQEKNDNAPVQADTTITVVFGKGNKITLPTPTDLDLPLGANNPLIDKSAGTDGVISAPTEGTVLIDPSNKLTFIYTPTFSSSASTDEFSYQIIDTVDYDKGIVQLDTARVIINLDQSSKNKPIARDTTFTIAEGGTLPVFNLSAICTTGASGGTLTIYDEGTTKPQFSSSYSLASNGDLVYVHNDSENFVDIITYSVNDNGGNTSAEGIITINIIPLNDNKPVLKVDTIFIEEGDQNASMNILDNDSTSDIDISTSLTALTIAATDSAKFGDVVVSADGTVIYNHDGTENELLDSFVVKVSDTASLNTAIADYSTGAVNIEDHKVYVVITPVNDNAPEASSKTYKVDEGGTLAVADSASGALSDAIDKDLDSMIGTVVLYPTLDVDSLFVFNSNGTFTYVHNGSELFTDSFTVNISDGELDTIITVIIDVNPINDETAIGSVDTFTVNEGGTLDSTVSFDLIIDSDEHDTIASPFGNFFTLHLQQTTKHGELILDTTNGTFTYVNNGIGEFVADSFTYVIEDSATYDKVNSNMSDPITVYIHVIDQNDETPVSSMDSIYVGEGDTTTLLYNNEASVLWNDTDADAGTTLKVFLVDSTLNGTITLDSTGSFEYAHDSSATVLDSFTYQATDGLNVGPVTTVKIGIEPKAPYTTELYYIDGDANGQIDTVFATFNEAIDLNNTDYSLIWSDDSTKVSIAEVIAGSKAESVILVLENAPQYRTNGTMILSATYNGFGGVVVEETVQDRAAPVVEGVVYIAKGSQATLTVKLSEPWYSTTKTFLKPFVHISNGTETVLDFGEAESNGSNYSYNINVTDMPLGKDDSIYINIADNVSDRELNEQLNSMNIRQPILSTNSIKSATYLDTNTVKDGKIDLISIEMTLAIDTTILKIIKKNSDKFLLNIDREFEFDTSMITFNNGNFEIAVTEKAAAVNTALSESDVVTIASAIPVGVNSIDQGTITVVDSVAPVPVSAAFAQVDDSTYQLTVEFSEEVESAFIKTTSGTQHGYVFTDVSRDIDNEFTMDLTPISVNKNSVVYTAKNIGIEYIVTGDLLRVETTDDRISDTLKNVQHLSVDIPITVQIGYDIEIDLLIFPQPFVLINNELDKKEAPALHNDMYNHYQLKEYERNGVAFIVEATGPLSPNMEAHEGQAQLFDNTGNAVSDILPMRFGTKEGGNTYGVVVWDGTNTYGRAVARGSLLLAVEVTVLTDEGPESKTISKEFIKTVGIQYSE